MVNVGFQQMEGWRQSIRVFINYKRVGHIVYNIADGRYRISSELAKRIGAPNKLIAKRSENADDIKNAVIQHVGAG